eukprot:389074-Rhodomonas_salina.1
MMSPLRPAGVLLVVSGAAVGPGPVVCEQAAASEPEPDGRVRVTVKHANLNTQARLGAVT